METFNRKLNMIKITGLILLLFLVKHGNATSSTPAALTPASSSLTVKSKISTEKPTSPTIAPSLNDTNKLSKNISTPSPPSTTTGPSKATPTTVPKTTPTTTTTTPKPPDECYKISCNKETCPVYENNTVNFPNYVKMCNRTNTGFCFVKKTVDSKNESIVNFTMGCDTTCIYKKDIVGCCQDNLCNGDLSLLNSGQYVKYNLLLSVLCIAISLF